LEKSNLQSIVQSAAELHDRNLPEIEYVLFLPVSGTNFFVQEKWRQKPHSQQQIFWRKKLAPETCQSQRGFILLALLALFSMTRGPQSLKDLAAPGLHSSMIMS